mmetsp:Transcript_19793/g.68713  ORF Transcript_19793/g.68713 Transcript_19793/m.68713 type:complete len:396 (+) Transcript_19793:42-1229(+)
MVASFVERRREPLGNTFVNLEGELAASRWPEVARRNVMRSASCPAHLDESWQTEVRTPGRECHSVVLEEASTAEDSSRRSSKSTSSEEDTRRCAWPQTPTQMITPGTMATPSTTTASASAAATGRRGRRGGRCRGIAVRSSAPISLFRSLGEDGGASSSTSAAAGNAAAALGAAAAGNLADREQACTAHSGRRSEPKSTTLMIRNLPVEVPQQEFKREVDESGFEGRYDFLHVPVELCSGVSKGFAFMNFRSAEAAACFQSGWHKQTRFGIPAGSMALNVSVADVQGQAALIENWSTPKNRRIRNPKFRPVILPTDRPMQCLPLTSVISRSGERDGGSRLGGPADPDPHAKPSAWHGAVPATASSPSFALGTRRKAAAVGSAAPSMAAKLIRSQI